MNPHGVSRLANTHDPIERSHDIGIGRLLMRPIVHEHLHIPALESQLILQILGYILGIIMTTGQLSLLPHIINANENTNFLS
jgi:hypothetical protein